MAALVGVALLSGCAVSSASRGNRQGTAALVDEQLAALKVVPVAQRLTREKQIIALAAGIGTPVSDGDTLIFLYAGPANQVEAVGSFVPPLEFDHVEGTDLWLARREIPDLEQATIGYFLSVDGKARRDPLSKLPPESTDPNQVTWRGSQVVPPKELKPQPGIPHGSMEHLSIASSHLGDTRAVSVYLPPGYDPQKRYPVIYAADEQVVEGRMQASVIFDNLIAEHRLQPLIGVFVASRYDTREREFLPEGDRWQQYQQFFVQELMPSVEGHYSVLSRRESRVVWGISNGATLAAFTALQWPALFRGAIAESPGFTQAEVVPAQDLHAPQEFYLIGGTQEQSFTQNFSYLVDSLRSNGFKVQAMRRPAGHEPVYWAEELVPALVALFPGGH